MKLTAEQKRRVRSLMVDEGNTRAEAVAWALAFEPGPALEPVSSFEAEAALRGRS